MGYGPLESGVNHEMGQEDEGCFGIFLLLHSARKGEQRKPGALLPSKGAGRAESSYRTIKILSAG